MKIKDNVYLFIIELDFLKDVVTQEVKEFKVLGSNNKCIVINDEYFTTININSKKNYCLHEELNDVGVTQSKLDGYFDYIRGSFYTSNANIKTAYSRIKEALEKYIQEKHGRYCDTAITMLDKIEI